MDRAHHLGEPMMDILLPKAGTGPGVVVLHPWWGLNPTIRAYGAALADAGFVVGLPDLFEGDSTTSIEEAEKLIRKHWAAADALAISALTALARHEAVTGTGIGAVGFSFGGFISWRKSAAPTCRWRAPWSTTPRTRSPRRTSRCWRISPPRTITRAPKTCKPSASASPPTARRTRLSPTPGTKHWFAEANRPEYAPEAATLAFERTVAFLKG